MRESYRQTQTDQINPIPPNPPLSPPTGLELREDIDTVLEPGMVVSMEPMVTIPEGQPGAGGYREHDVMVINQDGSVDNITGFPFGPEHNIFKK